VKILPTNISGSYLIDLDLISDDRGFFARYFCEKEFSKYHLNTSWVQINNSMSLKTGTLRGLHFQSPPKSEVKLVRCLRGAIWDVIVDLRKNSDSYGKWFGANLTEENRTMMYVPKGFAHGFITLQPDTEILYLVSEFYEPEFEQTLIWNDPDIAIQWPLDPQVISQKDLSGSTLKNFSI